ncbi:MAG: flagellar biosynthesis anti-sigma factor FlgM [Desulfobacter sp.]|nr:MAG: flagellar biosynthesis anti-sigma factor FlgM [Desulfobacter sp.]
MKITNTPPTYINQTYANQSNRTVKSKALKSDVKTDSINLSSTTRDMQKISAASQTDPENRIKKVEELKAKVQSNQYSVNADQVAEKMLGHFLDELG